MTPVSHTVISGVTTAVFGYFIPSWPARIACFLSGIFIDIDHIFDFFVTKKKIPLSYHELKAFCGDERRGKLYLFFHSYEFLLICWGIYFGLDLGTVWLGILVGMTIHFFADEIGNPLRPLAYFFVYRMKHGFDKEGIYFKDHYERLK